MPRFKLRPQPAELHAHVSTEGHSDRAQQGEAEPQAEELENCRDVQKDRRRGDDERDADREPLRREAPAPEPEQQRRLQEQGDAEDPERAVAERRINPRVDRPVRDDLARPRVRRRPDVAGVVSPARQRREEPAAEALAPVEEDQPADQRQPRLDPPRRPRPRGGVRRPARKRGRRSTSSRRKATPRPTAARLRPTRRPAGPSTRPARPACSTSSGASTGP